MKIISKINLIPIAATIMIAGCGSSGTQKRINPIYIKKQGTLKRQPVIHGRSFDVPQINVPAHLIHRYLNTDFNTLTLRDKECYTIIRGERITFFFNHSYSGPFINLQFKTGERKGKKWKMRFHKVSGIYRVTVPLDNWTISGNRPRLFGFYFLIKGEKILAERLSILYAKN